MSSLTCDLGEGSAALPAHSHACLDGCRLLGMLRRPSGSSRASCRACWAERPGPGPRPTQPLTSARRLLPRCRRRVAHLGRAQRRAPVLCGAAPHSIPWKRNSLASVSTSFPYSLPFLPMHISRAPARLACPLWPPLYPPTPCFHTPDPLSPCPAIHCRRTTPQRILAPPFTACTCAGHQRQAHPCVRARHWQAPHRPAGPARGHHCAHLGPFKAAGGARGRGGAVGAGQGMGVVGWG